MCNDPISILTLAFWIAFAAAILACVFYLGMIHAYTSQQRRYVKELQAQMKASYGQPATLLPWQHPER